MKFCPYWNHINLRQTFNTPLALNDFIYRLNSDLRTQIHQTVINILHIVIILNGEGLLYNDPPRINILVKKEGSYTCLCLTIYNSPINRSSTSILW